jgi:hypothetical protein
MTAETQSAPQQLPLVGRLLVRILQGVAGVIGGALCFLVCQDSFSGYAQYASGTLGTIAMILIAATGGAAWVIDHRRIDAGESADADGGHDDGN